mmetsp:Transcript_19078/g.26670  ORF Transcript_19078/g.26670 Transcript_19078/m.26670 type:complete len:254 (+) Transcript_19078:2027-2788(+)
MESQLRGRDEPQSPDNSNSIVPNTPHTQALAQRPGEEKEIEEKIGGSADGNPSVHSTGDTIVQNDDIYMGKSSAGQAGDEMLDVETTGSATTDPAGVEERSLASPNEYKNNNDDIGTTTKVVNRNRDHNHIDTSDKHKESNSVDGFQNTLEKDIDSRHTPEYTQHPTPLIKTPLSSSGLEGQTELSQSWPQRPSLRTTPTSEAYETRRQSSVSAETERQAFENSTEKTTIKGFYFVGLAFVCLLVASLISLLR